MFMFNTRSGLTLRLWGGLALVAGLGACGGGGSASRTGSGGTSAGSGGAVGTGGTGTGTGGAGGAVALSCSAAIVPAAAKITDFSDWNPTAGKWGTGSLMGSLFKYNDPAPDGGVASAVTSAVDPVTGNLSFAGTVRAGGYAGIGLSFDSCVDATAYTGIQFTMAGNTGGCALQLQVQTYSQQPTSNRGGCTANCYKFPAKQSLTVGTAPITVRFAELTGGMPTDAAAIKREMVGLQWQLTVPAPTTDAGTQMDCTGVALTLDDVSFVTN